MYSAAARIAALVLAPSSGSSIYSALTFSTSSPSLSSEKMRIDSSGNVGIGIISPTARLHLAAGTVTAGTAPLKFDTTTPVLMTTPENGAMEFDGTDYYLTAGGSRQKIVRGSASLGDFIKRTGDTMSGLLSIRREDSSTTLASSAAQEMLRVSNPDTTNNNWSTIGFYNSAEDTIAGAFSFQNTNTVSGYGDFVFATRGAGGWGERMRITNTGAVGIGVSPTEKLDVNGNINIPTTSATVGQIKINGAPFIQAFGTRNAFIGESAGNLTLTGTYNTAVGYTALAAVTTGIGNNALGAQALLSNTTGGSNVAVGGSALRLNTTGGANIAVGGGASYNNTIGGSNVAVGNDALASNTTGNENVAIGYSAVLGASGMTGSLNIGIGSSAMSALTTGSNNISMGKNTLNALTTGGSNVAIGHFAGTNVDSSSVSSVIIGNGAGPSTAATHLDSKLYIHNAASDTPLIYGDFFNNYVRINKNLELAEQAAGYGRIWSKSDGTLHYVTSGGVDTALGASAGIGTYVKIVGDTMSGNLHLGANKVVALGYPSATDDAANKLYVDRNLAGYAIDTSALDTNYVLKWNGTGWVAGTAGSSGNYVQVAGDTMSGNLYMSANKIVALGYPSATDDAVNKLYVDTSASALDANYVMKVGDTMSGSLSVLSNFAIGAAAGTLNKFVLDDRLGSTTAFKIHYGYNTRILESFFQGGTSQFWVDADGSIAANGNWSGKGVVFNYTNPGVTAPGTARAGISSTTNDQFLFYPTSWGGGASIDLNSVHGGGRTGTMKVRFGSSNGGGASANFVEASRFQYDLDTNRLSAFVSPSAPDSTGSPIVAPVELITILGDSGNTGIGGVTSPTAKLHLAAGTLTAGTAPLKFTAGDLTTAVENGAMEYNGTDFYLSTGGVRNKVVTGSASLSDFIKRTGDTMSGHLYVANSMHIDGNVGIGNTTPGYKLTVTGDAYFSGAILGTNGSASTGRIMHLSGSALLLGDVNNNMNSLGFELRSGGYTKISYANGGEPVLIQSAFNGNILKVKGAAGQTGNLQLWSDSNDATLSRIAPNGEIQAGNGSASAPSVSFLNDTDTGLFSAGADTLSFSTGGTARMTITPNGYTGIGTSAPDAPLTVHQSGASWATISTNTNVGAANSTSLWFMSDRDGTPNYAGIGQENDGSLRLTGGGALSAAGLIVSDGNSVGVGISPAAPLHVHRGSDAGIYITTDANIGANHTYLYFGSDNDGTVNWAGLGQKNDGALIFTGGNDLATFQMILEDGGNLGVGVADPAEKLEVDGTVKATDILLSSDRNLKKDIRTLDASLAKVLKLRPVSYKWRTEQYPDRDFDDREHAGFIAQEVAEVYPNFVRGEEGNLAVDYPAFIAPVVGSIQEQQRMIQENKLYCEQVSKNSDRKIASLNDKVDSLETELREQKQLIKKLINRIEKLEKK